MSEIRPDIRTVRVTNRYPDHMPYDVTVCGVTIAAGASSEPILYSELNAAIARNDHGVRALLADGRITVSAPEGDYTRDSDGAIAR